MDWFKGWLENGLENSQNLKYQEFIHIFMANIFTDSNLSRDDLMQLANPIYATHAHQDDTRSKQHSFFELLGPDYSEKIRPAYLKAIKQCQMAKNPKPYIDLDSPNSRGFHKTIYNAYNEILREIIHKNLPPH